MGGPPPKKLGAKNVQNFSRFRTTSNFARKYLRNGQKYQKSERHVIDSDSSRARRKSPVNNGPLTTPYYKHSLTHPNQLFQTTIFWPYGALLAQIFTRASEWPSLLAHTRPRKGVPPTIFNNEQSSIPKLAQNSAY